MRHILKCIKCGSYGLKEKCECGEGRIEPRPPKYTSLDKYGEYRRKAKSMKTGEPAKNIGIDHD